MSKPGGWFDRWKSGGRARGNREGALEGEARQVRFRGGQECPKGCGSVIAYQVGKPPQFSVKRHTNDPRACRKHDANKSKK
jgi:hypothetical protein